MFQNRDNQENIIIIVFAVLGTYALLLNGEYQSVYLPSRFLLNASGCLQTLKRVGSVNPPSTEVILRLSI